jgi:hypothetical protein
VKENWGGNFEKLIDLIGSEEIVSIHTPDGSQTYFKDKYYFSNQDKMDVTYSHYIQMMTSEK